MSREDDPAAILSMMGAERPDARSSMTQIAWGSLIGVAAVMSVLSAGGYWQVSALRSQIDDRKAELKDLDTRYSELDTEYRQLETSFNQLKYISSVLPAAQVKQAIRPLTDNQPTPAAAPKAKEAVAPAAAPKPKLDVYIQIANENQLPKAENAAARLRSAGYNVRKVSGIVLVGNGLAPQTTQLRYFQRKDEQEADLPGVTQALQQAGIDARPRYVELSGSSMLRPEHFELWLGTNE